MKSSFVSSYRLALCTNVSFFPISGSLWGFQCHHNHPFLLCAVISLSSEITR
jgi:hypothetical protein